MHSTVKNFKLQKISPPREFFRKMVHLLSSDLEIQTYMVKVHLACQNYQKLQVQFLWHEMMCMDYVFHAGSGGGAHRMCTIGCRLTGDSSFSVELVMHAESVSTTSRGSLSNECSASGVWVVRQ
jgi:hypothetical protein